MIIISIVVLIVLVVVGQIVRSIWSKTLAVDCLCTLQLCTPSLGLLPANSDIWGIFCKVFCQAFLKRVYGSAVYNFIWFPGYWYFYSVKVLSNWCVEIFYNNFLLFPHCFLFCHYKVIREKPHALIVVNPFRYLNTSISCPRSILCTSWWDKGPGFSGGSSGFISGIIFVALLSTFSILSISHMKCGDQLELHCRFEMT